VNLHAIGLQSDKKKERIFLGDTSKKFLEALASIKSASSSAYSCNIRFSNIPAIATKRRTTYTEVKATSIQAVRCERYIMDLVHAHGKGLLDMHDRMEKEAVSSRMQR
jgi:hypothetical protein